MFHDEAGSTDTTPKLYEGHAHDLLNDFEREKVIADIRDWLLAHASRRKASRGGRPD